MSLGGGVKKQQRLMHNASAVAARLHANGAKKGGATLYTALRTELQHAPAADKVHDCGQPVSGLEIGEDEGAFFTH